MCLRENGGEEPPTLMMGDPNARLGRKGEEGWCTKSNGHGRVLRTVVADRDLVVGNKEEPTCYTWNGSSNIDLVLYDRECEGVVGRTWVGEDVGSDHRPVLVELMWDMEGPVVIKREMLDWEGADWEGLKDVMHGKGREMGDRDCWPAGWEELSAKVLVETQAEWFTSALQEAVRINVPTKTVSRKRGQPFWWTKEAAEARLERQRLHEVWRRSCVTQGHRSRAATSARKEHARGKEMKWRVFTRRHATMHGRAFVTGSRGTRRRHGSCSTLPRGGVDVTCPT